MPQNFYLKIFLILLSFSSIFSLNLSNTRSKNSRSLEELTEVNFVSATDLFFNSDSNWQFTVRYTSDQELPLNTIYSISVLYKESENVLAQCEPNEGFILNCYLNLVGQAQTDLVQLNYEATFGATLKLNGILVATNIPIMTSLVYEDSYNLKYFSSGDKHWEFQVKIKENEENVLPENSLVKIDLLFDSTNKVVADCIHNRLMLNCRLVKTKPNNNEFLIKISSEKLDGSIFWQNLEDDAIIPLIYNPTNVQQGYNLAFINGQWNYTIWLRDSNTALGSASTLITMNSRIISTDGTIHILFTKCFRISTEDTTFSCIVIGENQAKSDLVYTSKEKVNEANIQTSTTLYNNYIEKQIIRNVELSLIKAYDLEYISHNWYFKIKVENDENLPVGCVVKVDIPDNSYNPTCTYEIDHILNCESSASSSILIRLKEKYLGTVTWINLKDKFISIPLKQNLRFTNAKNAFFTDKWHFLVFSPDLNYADTPKNSTMVLDIIQKGEDTTASCELTRYGLWCVSDYGSQSLSDEIKISLTKKSGSITWASGIDDTNNLVQKESLEDSNIKTGNLAFKYAYNMYYSKTNNKWIFSIHVNSDSYTTTMIGIYKVDITVTKSSENIKSIAICLLHDGINTNQFNTRLQCSCEYDNQEKTDLIKISYPKSELSTVTWNSGINQDYPIILNAELTIKKAYNLIKTTSPRGWTFNIDIESDSNLVLPLNSNLTVDISQTTKVATCLVNAGYKLFCSIEDHTVTSEPKLLLIKSPGSSVRWTNTNEEDYFMLCSATLYLFSTDYLYFLNGKWHFSLKVSGVSDAKIIIDILYNNNPSTATCYGGRNYLINCTVNEDTQLKTDLVKLKKEKPDGSESTVTWSNLVRDEDIPLWTELTLDKADNLHENEDSTKWLFDAYIKDEDIPQGAFIIVDVRFLYLSSSNEIYMKYMNSIANCYHESKKLTCTVVIQRTEDNLYYYGTNLVKTKNPSTASSLIEWKDMTGEILPITLSANLNYFYSHGIKQEDTKKIFYIELLYKTQVPKGNPCKVGIIIDNVNSLSDCIVQNHTTLKCEINEDITNKKVYIAKDQITGSTIKWNNLIINQNLNQVELSFIHTYSFFEETLTHASFRLIASGDELANGLIYPVKVHQKRGTLFDKIVYASCYFSYDIFFCDWYNTGASINSDSDHINLMLLGEGDIIKWKNPNDYDIVQRKSYNVYFNNLLYCYYDKNNKYYKYSISTKRPLENDVKYVMKLLYNNIPTYGLCIPKESILDCITANKNEESTETIYINKTFGYNANLIWIDLNENLQLYPFVFYYADVLYIYGLQITNDNKWVFNVKYSQISEFEGSIATIDIILDGAKSTASCSIIDAPNQKLECESGESSALKLITLNDEWVSSEHLRLMNTVNNGIPLIASLTFVKAYSLKYQDGWSFYLNAKIPESSPIQIPSKSTFSIDIKFNEDSTIKEELAFCTENSRDSDNVMNLHCVPQNHISPYSLIKLSEEAKTAYASVTWTAPGISSADTIIYLDLELNVEYVTIPEFDEDNQKWKFEMVISNDDPLPIEAQIKIDIKYNAQDKLATCELIEQNKFGCTPDVNPQNANDKFTITPTKNQGTVSFSNSPETLEFIIALYYLQSSNFNLADSSTYSKYSFEIGLSKTNMKEGEDINIDILIKNNPSKAACKHNSNKLNCEFTYEGEGELDTIKIKNDKTNGDFRWYNIPDEVVLLNQNNIEVYGYYYNLDEKILILEEGGSIGKTKDDILEEIRKKFLNKVINYNHINNGNYFYVNYKNVKYILSKSDDTNSELPSVKLDDCLTKLQEGLPSDSNLYILYIQVTDPTIRVSNIQYEIYSMPKTAPISNISKLDLDVCKEMKVDVEVEVNIPEGDMDLYNSSSGFYNDICYTYKSDRGTDVTLKDRRDDYINNNLAVCDNGCELTSYDYTTYKASCSCPISLTISSISKIKIDKERLKSNFLDISNVANTKILKCYSTFFSSKIKKNVGFFVNTIVLVLEIGSVFGFYFYSLNLFKIQLKNILEQKKLEKDESSKEEKSTEDKRKSIKNIKFEMNAPPKKSLVDGENDNNEEDNIETNKQNVRNDLQVDIHNNNENIFTKTEDKLENKNKSNEEKVMNLNDTEINTLSYIEALDLDKRQFYKYYLSLLRTKHLFIFTFFSRRDYNSRIVKIQLFFFTFVLNYTVNGLFFNDSTMHKIYSDGGGFDLEYHIPQIVYSTIISSVIITLVKFTALTEGNVIKIKSAKLTELETVYKSEAKCMKIKMIIFYVIIFILLLFCWYYVGCFCAVYENTQTQLLKDTVSSFAAAMIYPFVIDLIPGLFRIPALRDKDKKSSCRYTFSKLIQACI